MSRLLGTRAMIKRLLGSIHDDIHGQLFLEWVYSDIPDPYDAMGVCLMGGEL